MKYELNHIKHLIDLTKRDTDTYTIEIEAGSIYSPKISTFTTKYISLNISNLDPEDILIHLSNLPEHIHDWILTLRDQLQCSINLYMKKDNELYVKFQEVAFQYFHPIELTTTLIGKIEYLIDLEKLRTRRYRHIYDELYGD